jgi:hypothetical protein
VVAKDERKSYNKWTSLEREVRVIWNESMLGKRTRKKKKKNWKS